jgi:MFS family permease
MMDEPVHPGIVARLHEGWPIHHRVPQARLEDPIPSPISTRPVSVPRPVPAVRSGAVRHGTGFWLTAFAFLVSMAFSGVPTPLYAIYQRQDGFSTFMITVAFAAYALGVVASLFLAGHVSDWLGRRRMTLAAILVEAVSAVVFLSSASLPVLITARVVSGLGIGMLTATATAYLAELHATARPQATRTRSDLVSTAANIGGLAVGPLVAGLLAQYAGTPLRTSYFVFLGLLLLAAAAVTLVPETVTRPAVRPAYRPQRVSVPAAHRSTFFAASAAVFVALAVLGLFTSLAPGFVAGTLDHPSRALAGLIAFLVFGSAATVQMVLSRLDSRRTLAIGLSLMTLGLAGVTTGVWATSLAGFLAGGIVAGAGAGLLFKGSLATVVRIASPEARGEALAGFFLAGYTGLAVPVLGLGTATLYVADRTALLGFAAVLVLVCAAISRRLLRQD